MVGKLPRYAEGNAKWYISKAGYAASMMRLIDAAGGNTIATLQGGANMREFLGYPVVITQVMNSTLTAQTSTDGLCYFGDLRQGAAFGNRRGVSVMVSEHRYMEFDELAIRGTQRFDINVHETGSATVASSLIMLSTPAS
jgi:HK97 family phage major capsid protein